MFVRWLLEEPVRDDVWIGSDLIRMRLRGVCIGRPATIAVRHVKARQDWLLPKGLNMHSLLAGFGVKNYY